VGSERYYKYSPDPELAGHENSLAGGFAVGKSIGWLRKNFQVLRQGGKYDMVLAIYDCKMYEF